MPQRREPQTAWEEQIRQALYRNLARLQKSQSAGRVPDEETEGMGCVAAGLLACLSCLLSVLLCYSLITGSFEEFLLSLRESVAPAWKVDPADVVKESLAKGNAFYHGLGVPRDPEIAFAHFLKAASAGNALAQFTVGNMLLNGEGVSKDKDSALGWFRKAAGQGNVGARDILKKLEEDMAMDALPAEELLARAHACLEGKGVPQDKAEAARWFRKAAMKHDAEAQHQLAVLLLNGDGVRQDPAEAADWLRKAAGQGHGAARFLLAMLYDEGKGVPQDKAQAVEWYRRAAGQGIAEAQYKLAHKLLTGDGVAQDKAQAAAWFRKAAGQGVAEAQYNLGLMYGSGDGVAKDLHAAARWLQEAAAQGHERARQALTRRDTGLRKAYGENLEADRLERDRLQREELTRRAHAGEVEKQYELGMAYLRGRLGLPEDGAQAVVWLRKAGEQQHLPALTRLAEMYAHGWGIPQDRAQVMLWLRMAGELGDAGSQEELARMYHTGDGIPRDMGQALFWYRKLAEGGAVNSMRTIAEIYAEGDGVPRDMEKANFWSLKAAMMGDEEAPLRLGNRHARGDGVPRDRQRAILWYHWAALAGNNQAMLELGRIYAAGLGVPQDELLAAAWYRRIYAQGYALEDKVGKALSLLEVDENLVREWDTPIKLVQGARMEMARFELTQAGVERGELRRNSKYFISLCDETERACSAFLKEWQKLKKAGDNVPPQIRDMAASVAIEAEKALRAIEAVRKDGQPEVSPQGTDDGAPSGRPPRL